MENIKEQFARLYMELDLTDDQAAMINKLQRDVDAALRQPFRRLAKVAILTINSNAENEC